jgi:hypothetical protein
VKPQFKVDETLAGHAMNLTTTLLFYLLVGIAVAAAGHLSTDAAAGRERWFRTVTALLFWPLYLPALLHAPAVAAPEPLSRAETADPASPSDLGPSDEISSAIRQVESELDLALGTLDGWSDAVLAREQCRFEELRAAWHAQAAKIHELDDLLQQPAFAVSPTGPLAASPAERVAKSEQARLANIERLRAVRRRLHDDLFNTLAWVRELVTMIHLAKYTGAPASRAEELVMQIATCVEGLSEVAAWRDCTAADSSGGR